VFGYGGTGEECHRHRGHHLDNDHNNDTQLISTTTTTTVSAVSCFLPDDVFEYTLAVCRRRQKQSLTTTTTTVATTAMVDGQPWQHTNDYADDDGKTRLLSSPSQYSTRISRTTSASSSSTEPQATLSSALTSLPVHHNCRPEWNDEHRGSVDDNLMPDGLEDSRQSSLSTHLSSHVMEFFLKEKELLYSYSFVIVVVVMIQICAQITGCNVIRNYAPTLYEKSGVSTQAALTYNVVLGVVKLLFTVVSVLYVERGGRRSFLLVGIVLVTVGMGFLCAMSFSSHEHNGNIHNPIAFTVGCAIVYAGFGIGYGPAPWILSSEMIPTAVRGRIMSLCLIASNLAQLLMNFIFLPMTSAISTAGSFFVFMILNVLTFCFVYLFLVETKEALPKDILARTMQRRRDVVRWVSWCTSKTRK
jgi:hypothetical protein